MCSANPEAQVDLRINHDIDLRAKWLTSGLVIKQVRRQDQKEPATVGIEGDDGIQFRHSRG
jgi:hypothetical protein